MLPFQGANFEGQWDERIAWFTYYLACSTSNYRLAVVPDLLMAHRAYGERHGEEIQTYGGSVRVWAKASATHTARCSDGVGVPRYYDGEGEL